MNCIGRGSLHPLLMVLAGCSSDPSQPTGPEDAPVSSTATASAVQTAEAPKQLALADSCAEVTKTFGFRPPLQAHISRYGFAEKLDGNTFPIFEGTAEENAKVIEAALSAYEKLAPQLDPEVKKDADAFATVARQRAKNIRAYQKAGTEQKAASKDPKQQAIADSACFGMIAMTNDKCPASVFGKELKEMGRVADGIEARCGIKPVP